jgi:hypothetical protein
VNASIEPSSIELSRRDRAILRAVAGGRAELLVGVEPDLYLDGRCCADQVAARRLARAGLIAAVTRGGPRSGSRPGSCPPVGDTPSARSPPRHRVSARRRAPRSAACRSIAPRMASACARSSSLHRDRAYSAAARRRSAVPWKRGTTWRANSS